MFGGAAERAKHRGDQVAEAARLAGADIEDAGHRRRVEQPAHHRDRVVDIDEVALLLAVGDAVAVRLEQPHRLAALGLVEALGDEAHHLALVVLVRPEHVEEFQARPLRRQRCRAGEAVGDRQIEQCLLKP